MEKNNFDWRNNFPEGFFKNPVGLKKKKPLPELYFLLNKKMSYWKFIQICVFFLQEIKDFRLNFNFSQQEFFFKSYRHINSNKKFFLRQKMLIRLSHRNIFFPVRVKKLIFPQEIQCIGTKYLPRQVRYINNKSCYKLFKNGSII